MQMHHSEEPLHVISSLYRSSKSTHINVSGVYQQYYNALLSLHVVLEPPNLISFIYHCGFIVCYLLVLLNLNALVHIKETRRLYLTPMSLCSPT